jgi:hypothetical protein
MARFHCRCRKCDARKVLRFKPEEYKVQPQCICGRRDFRVDRYMQTRDTKTNACFCEGYPFKHRRSSLYCWFRRDGTGRYPGDPDFWDRNMSQEEHDALVESKRLESYEQLQPAFTLSVVDVQAQSREVAGAEAC